MKLSINISLYLAKSKKKKLMHEMKCKLGVSYLLKVDSFNLAIFEYRYTSHFTLRNTIQYLKI